MTIETPLRGRLTILQRIQARGPAFQTWLTMNNINPYPAHAVNTLDPYTLGEDRIDAIMLTAALSKGLSQCEFRRLTFLLKNLSKGSISHSLAMELLARAMGYKNYTLAALCRDPDDPERFLENIWEGSVVKGPVPDVPSQRQPFAENPRFLQLYTERASKNRELSAAKRAEREQRRGVQ